MNRGRILETRLRGGGHELERTGLEASGEGVEREYGPVRHKLWYAGHGVELVLLPVPMLLLLLLLLLLLVLVEVKREALLVMQMLLVLHLLLSQMMLLCGMLLLRLLLLLFLLLLMLLLLQAPAGQGKYSMLAERMLRKRTPDFDIGRGLRNSILDGARDW